MGMDDLFFPYMIRPILCVKNCECRYQRGIMNEEHAAFVVEIAYNAISASILIAAVGILCGCIYAWYYAWYRFFLWIRRRLLRDQ